MEVRDARDADMPGVLAIYNDAVQNTTAVWNETPRSMQDQMQWFGDKRAQSYPVLVADHDGAVAGFCSYGPFRAWYGYRFSVENSIYVADAHRRRGVARSMLTALVERARSQGYHMMVAGIEARNDASIRLHEGVGFVKAAHMHEVGFKFERWLDLILMERRLERK